MSDRLTDLQLRVMAWHSRRFPAAAMEHVALKVCEEAGELGRAVNGRVGRNSATGGGDIGGEAADVFIATMVLLSRWFPEIDVLGEVEKKVRLLEDGNSSHPASLTVLP